MQDAQSPHPVVLFLEADPVSRVASAFSLRKNGFDVLQATSVAEAEAILSQRDDIDVVITDAALPGERDGADLAALLVHQAPWLRVVVLAGSPRLGGLDNQGLGARAAFLAKPYSRSDLVRAVQAAVFARRVGAATPQHLTE